MTALLAHLPHVRHVVEASIESVFPLGANGVPDLSPAADKNIEPLAIVDGLGFTQDRATVIAGRMANPTRPNEVVMTAAAASLLGVHVGSMMPLGLYTAEQMDSLSETSIPTFRPYRRIDARVVGLIVLNTEAVQDDIDRYPTQILYTPALTKDLLTPPFLGGEGWTDYGLQLDHGDADVTAVEREIDKAVPKGTLVLYHVTSQTEAEAQRAIAPEVIALWMFGGIAALAALFVSLQAISRQLQGQSDEREVLRAVGGDAWMTAADGLVGIAGSVVVGTLLAVVVAIALSPLSPIGPIRPIYPYPGISFDWLVLGLGSALLVVALVGVSVGLAVRNSPDRVARREQESRERPSLGVRARPQLACQRLPSQGCVLRLCQGPAGRPRQCGPPCSEPWWLWSRSSPP